MYGLVVRFDLLNGHEAAFDQLAAQTVAQVEEREAGTIVYACHRMGDADGSRVFYELYRDEAAFEEHEKQEHVRRFLAEREQHLARAPRVEFLSLQVATGVPTLDGG